MADFIRSLLITKIKEQIKEKERILKFDGFFFLDKDIKDDKKIINRLNKHSLYPKEELVRLSWSHVIEASLLEVYSQLKDNKFFIYKILDGKSHKMRIKNKR